MILIDTNVLVAALVADHIHHETSVECLLRLPASLTVAAAHSLAECYSTLTRINGLYRYPAVEAWTATANLATRIRFVALTAPQTLDAVRRFSALGIGPRLYDYLIGASGELAGAQTIVTWNVRHFGALFPELKIVTPAEA